MLHATMIIGYPLIRYVSRYYHSVPNILLDENLYYFRSASENYTFISKIMILNKKKFTT